MKAMLFNRKLCICALVLPFLFVFGSTAGGALPPEDKLWNLPPVKKTLPASDFDAAISLYKKERYGEAQTMFQTILSGQKGNALAHYYYANCLAKSGQLELARAEYNLALKYTSDQELSNFCIQAIQALNRNPNMGVGTGTGKASSIADQTLAGKAAMPGATKQLDQQAETLRNELIADHKRKVAEKNKELEQAKQLIKRQLEEDIAAKPGSETELRRKALYKIKILEIDFAADAKPLEEAYVKRLESFNSAHANLKGQMGAKVGASQVVPSNTTMTVRNYMNFGGLESDREQVKAVEAPSPGLRARAGVLKPTAPSSGSKGAVRPGR